MRNVRYEGEAIAIGGKGRIIPQGQGTMSAVQDAR